jgi:hypothetical protein
MAPKDEWKELIFEGRRLYLLSFLKFFRKLLILKEYDELLQEEQSLLGSEHFALLLFKRIYKKEGL